MRYLTGCPSIFSFLTMHVTSCILNLYSANEPAFCNKPVLVRIIIVKQLVFWLPNLFIISFTVSLINPIKKRIHQCALQLEDWLNEMLNSVWVSVQIFLTSYQRIVKFSTIEIHLKNVNRRRDKNVYEVKFIAQVLEVSHLNKLLP